VEDDTPSGLLTPETYLGYLRMDRYTGTPVTKDRAARYTPATTLGNSEITFGGTWTVGGEQSVAGAGGGTIRLHFQARDVYIVLGGKGIVRTSVNGKPGAPIRVDGYRLYTAVDGSRTIRDGVLALRFSRGVGAYAFTFG
jgi:hypothetical protein